MTAISDFRSAVRQFEKTSSASGSKISKAEMSKALETLTSDGKITAAERTAAKDLLESGKLTKGARDVLQAFVDGQSGTDTAGGLKQERREAILAQFNKLDRQGLIEWKNPREAMPVGGRVHSESLYKERHPDGFAFSVLIPTGALTPTAPQKDPNKVNEFYIQRSGGLAGMTQIAGPFSLKQMESSKGGMGALIDSRSTGNTASSKPSAEMLANIKDIFANAHGVRWTNSLPVGAQYVKAPISRENHPDGFAYTAFIPAGGNKPGSKLDVSNATHFWVQKSGGFAGITQYAGPFPLKNTDDGPLIHPRKPDVDTDGPLIHPRKPDDSGVNAQTLAKMQKALQKALGDGSLSWRRGESVPMGPAYARTRLAGENHPDGFQYTALVPSGSLNPRFPAQDPNKATSFFVVRTGGFAGLTETAGPISIK